MRNALLIVLACSINAAFAGTQWAAEAKVYQNGKVIASTQWLFARPTRTECERELMKRQEAVMRSGKTLQGFCAEIK